jgi:urease alpha subunit
VGIKNGRISGIGKAGNPDVQSGVSEQMIVGVNTEVVAGEGKIVTAGAIDAHVHVSGPSALLHVGCLFHAIHKLFGCLVHMPSAML